jgi:hypothetical protein
VVALIYLPGRGHDPFNTESVKEFDLPASEAQDPLSMEAIKEFPVVKSQYHVRQLFF